MYGQLVAVKQLDRNGLQGNREFLVEVLMLSLLHHQNLVNLIGYCADGDQRLLVYEFMPLGSLEDHLFGTNFSCFKLYFQILDDYSTFFRALVHFSVKKVILLKNLFSMLTIGLQVLLFLTSLVFLFRTKFYRA